MERGSGRQHGMVYVAGADHSGYQEVEMYQAKHAIQSIGICVSLLLSCWFNAWGQIPLHHQIASGTLLDRPLSFRKLEKTFSSSYKGIRLEEASEIIRARMRQLRDALLQNAKIAATIDTSGMHIKLGVTDTVIGTSKMTIAQILENAQESIASAIDSMWIAPSGKYPDSLQGLLREVTATILDIKDATPGKIIARRVIERARPAVMQWIRSQPNSLWPTTETVVENVPKLLDQIATEIQRLELYPGAVILEMFNGMDQAIMGVLESAEGWLRLPDASFALAQGAGDTGGSTQITCPGWTTAWFKPVLVIHGSFNTIDSLPGRIGASLLLRGAWECWALEGLIAYENHGGSEVFQIGCGGMFPLRREILFGVSVLLRSKENSQSADYNPSVGFSLKGASSRSPIIVAGASWNGKSHANPLIQIIYPLSSLE